MLSHPRHQHQPTLIPSLSCFPSSSRGSIFFLDTMSFHISQRHQFSAFIPSTHASCQSFKIPTRTIPFTSPNKIPLHVVGLSNFEIKTFGILFIFRWRPRIDLSPGGRGGIKKGRGNEREEKPKGERKRKKTTKTKTRKETTRSKGFFKFMTRSRVA